MAEHQGLPVAGYQSQPRVTVDAVNRNKRKEEEILRIIDELYLWMDPSTDQRWLAIARTHIELGFMAMNRAIFQPKRLTDKELER